MAELVRVNKAKSAVELELGEEKRGIRIRHGLVIKIGSELDSLKKALNEAELERHMLPMEKLKRVLAMRTLLESRELIKESSLIEVSGLTKCFITLLVSQIGRAHV